jgi:hypothetical protein
MSRSWKVIKVGENPVVQFTEQARGVQCDNCGTIVPESYVEYVSRPKNGHHDGRQGKYAFCRNVWAGQGMAHKSCQ